MAAGLRNTPANILAIPTAKVGAPPVRPNMVVSPTLAASAFICASVTGNPCAVIEVTTSAGVPFMLIAKYSPGDIEQAAIRASMPTSISVIMAP